MQNFISIQYQTEAVRLVFAEDGNTFTAEHSATVAPTITYNDTVITPDASGVYTLPAIRETDQLTVSATGMAAGQNHAPGVGLSGEDLTSYNPDLFSHPVWEGDTVYHEAVMFSKGKLQSDTLDGNDTVLDQTEKQLLYPIDDVISVRSADLKTWYVKGVDYDVKDGKLIWLENSRMPIYTGYLTCRREAPDSWKDTALADHGTPTTASFYTTGENTGLYLIYDGNHEKNTVYVTYRHTKTWADLGQTGYVPTAPTPQGEQFSDLYRKIASGKDIHVMIAGASTATGCSSSGANMNYHLLSALDEIRDLQPGVRIKAPTFFEQATASLVRKYGTNNPIHYHNIALGGISSHWALSDQNWPKNPTGKPDIEPNGKTRLVDRVEALEAYYRAEGELAADARLEPDLIYIKFAGNDIGVAPDTYEKNIRGIIREFRETLGYKNAAIILMAGKVNNQRTHVYDMDNTGIPTPVGRENYKNHQREQEKRLIAIAEETDACITVKGTSFWENVIRSKDVEDYLSNNINHANDFWAMLTAQNIVATVSKKQATK